MTTEAYGQGMQDFIRDAAVQYRVLGVDQQVITLGVSLTTRHKLRGYDAVQLAFDAVAERKLTKGELGHLAKFKVGAHRKLVEFRGGIDGAVEGETVTVSIFEPGDKVKVAGIGIGKGFQGTIKRHNFSSGPRSHGSHNIRKPGSIGASATPSRVRKGIKMAGRMGGKRVTQLGLTVHDVDAERNLLLVKGAVPGPKNGIVEVRG